MSKLKKIKVLSTKITKVGKQAFKKTNVKLKIQVPKEKTKKIPEIVSGKGTWQKSKYRVIYERKRHRGLKNGVFFCFWTKGDFICILQKNDLQ